MKDWQHSIGRDAALSLAETNWWEGKSAREIVDKQLFIAELCMPFDEFHKALEGALGRSVWTHELASIDSIKQEFLGARRAPTIEEIVALLPADKMIVVADTPQDNR